jgi:hypothetical protein
VGLVYDPRELPRVMTSRPDVAGGVTSAPNLDMSVAFAHGPLVSGAFQGDTFFW